MVEGCAEGALGRERRRRWAAGRLLGCCLLICTLGSLVATGSAPATGNTRYVSSSGDNTDNDCTDSSNPCGTVQYAVDQANAGDTVAVAGMHNETVLVRLSLAITQWAGEAPAVLDGSNTNPSHPVVSVDGTDTNTPPVVSVSGITVEDGASNDGMSVTGAALTVENSTISHNADNGISVESGGTVTVENSTISHNGMSAVEVDAGKVTVENSTISQNSESGIYTLGAATVVRSAIAGNSASIGAGIYVAKGGTLLVADSTLIGNVSAGLGGALLNNGTTTVENSTIAHNSSTGGSAIATLNNHATLAGDILAKQTSGSDCSPAGGIVDDGYNLDDDGSCISSTSPGQGSRNGTTANGSSTYGAVLDAYLADLLGNNGGPTQTLALLNNPTPATTEPNPALAVVPASFNLPVPVDARSAACSVPDQRGVTPAAGIQCDIGAYLLQATRTSLATSSGMVHSGAPVTYTATLSPAPGGGTVAFSDGAGNPATMNCSRRPLMAGEATCTVSYRASGAFSVTATYSGDGSSNHYARSTSRPPVRQIVSTVPAPVPRLSHLLVQPHQFRAATKGKATIALIAHGTVITYRDTLAADTTLRVYRKLHGAKRGRECVAAPKGKRHRKGKPCVRLVLVGTFTHHDQAGANRLHFTGRLRGRALRPGGYKLEITAKLAGRHSDTLNGSFMIIARSSRR